MGGTTPIVTSTGIIEVNNSGDASSSSKPEKNEPQAGAGSNTTSHTKQKPYCRYFGSKTGCRAGDSCAFIHDTSRLPQADRGTQDADSGEAPHQARRSRIPNKPSADLRSTIPGPDLGPDKAASGVISSPQEIRRYMPGPVDGSRVVLKPVPRAQTDDPREFQIQQLRRRYSPQEVRDDGGTKLTFRLFPSDPDFPFEIEALECVMRVPLDFPSMGKPNLKVTNKEMGRGYQINVEKGFDELVTRSPKATLLSLLNALDRQLEGLLATEKADTIKLVSNSGPIKDTHRGAATESSVRAVVPTQAPSRPREVILTDAIFTAEQKAQAQSKRDADTRQLEARLGRLPLFFKASDGIAYTVPLDPRKRGELPVPLQMVKSVRLFVPLLYNLQPCRIEVLGVSREAATYTEKAFEKRAKDHAETSLMGHINYLSLNMHIMATEPAQEDTVEVQKASEPEPVAPSRARPEDLLKQVEPEVDRSHIKYIPRPPEWTLVTGDEQDQDTDFSSYDSEEEFTDEAVEGHDSTIGPSASNPERGILLSFPFLELYGIELLELISLCITIKCQRCKDTKDISDLRDNAKRDSSGVRSESCKKCAHAFGIGFRREFMHSNSVRAGFLDLDGCTVVDLLPRYHSSE
ncbi:MAG: hypothetical protein M1827_007721 [Pycnora praestabilis]|nr:MAG: hypothetical protein M1827_007721 [Pycnora praestabilis]